MEKFIEERLINSLTPHPLNDLIYSDTCSQELIDSIKQHGFSGTIEISKDDVIISGHRRFNALKALKFETVPVTVLDETDQDKLIEYLILMNQTSRERTPEQKAREYQALKDVEERRAKERQGTRTDIVVNFPQCSEAGKARDIAAHKVGLSGKTAEKAASVVKIADDLKNEDPEKAQDLLDTLNNKSVSAAYQKVQVEQKAPLHMGNDTFTVTEENGLHIATPKNPKYKSSFNEEKNDSIEWAKWSWNPVTGCRFNCPYCYAKKIAENDRYSVAFPQKFNPTFHPGRLDAPKNTKTSASFEKVFVCSMADLFGDWIPSEWIQQVIDVCKEQSQWTYLFLTKNPKRYLEFKFPENCWLGATATNQQQFDKAIEVFKKNRNYAYEYGVSFLSIEPLMDAIDIYEDDDTGDRQNNLHYVDWVIIGGLKGSENKDTQPQWSWVRDIICGAVEAGTPVYFKPNLTVRPMYMPMVKSRSQRGNS